MPNENVVLLFYSTLQSMWTSLSVCIKEHMIYLWTRFLSVSLYLTRSVINRIITTTFYGYFERRKSTLHLM